MKLQANPKSTHIKVIPAPDEVLSKLRPDQTSHSAVYMVHGVTVGTTHLMFNATTVGGKVISSWPSEIQVFDALKLSPKYITLLPTAVFQVSHSVVCYMYLSMYTFPSIHVHGGRWGAIAQWSKHLQLKQEALGSIPGSYPGCFLFQLVY